MQNRSGLSLFDVIITLAVLAVLAVMATPGWVRARDAYAVRAARDAAAAVVERARSLATSRGSARLVVDPAAAELQLEAPAGTRAASPVSIGHAFGVHVTVDGRSSGAVALDFNVMGLGVVANRTLRFRRGREEAGLTLSIYGRARRW
jgi:type II secretory pathway pseudopilin PulG